MLRQRVALMVLSLCGLTAAARADPELLQERTLPHFKAQAVSHIDASLRAGWLNPSCILLVIQDGAFLVSDDGQLSACQEQCVSLAAHGLLVPGGVAAPGGILSKYRITPAALKYLEPHMSSPAASKLCAAQASLASLDYMQTRGAGIEGDFDQLIAGYRVQLGAPAEWALVPAVRTAFPLLASPTATEQQVFEASFTRQGALLVLERE